MGYIVQNRIIQYFYNRPAVSRFRSLINFVNYLAHFMAFLYSKFKAGIEAI